MKKSIYLVMLFMFVVTIANAQNYQLNKFKYDYRKYVPEYGDPYNPTVSGICSFILPGLGQMLNDEPGRGLGFLAGSAGMGLITVVGYASMITSVMDGDGYYRNNGMIGGAGLFLMGLSGMAAISIWSIVDAVHVAKVNNMYIRDLRKTSSIDLEISPYITQFKVDDKTTTPVGLTMRLKF